MKRKEVYKIIDGEREYQEWRWENAIREDGIPDKNKPPAEWLNYIKFHLERAEITNYELNKSDTMEEVRKIAALAVRAMEIHGCPVREIHIDIND